MVSSAIILTLAFGIKYLKTSKQTNIPSKKPAQTSPLSTPFSTPIPESLNLESCDIKLEENPLVQGKIEKFTSPDAKLEQQAVVVGRFYGILHTFDLNTNKTEADIQLISPKGDQVLPFHIKDAPGIIQNTETKQHMSITTLKPGLTILMSFNCFPNMKYGERFKITQFAVTGKL